MVKYSKRQARMITVRLGNEELALCKRAAALAGKSLNQWCVDVLLEAAENELPKAFHGDGGGAKEAVSEGSK